MEEIVHAFGIDWRLIAIQMFNFAILMGALWYFLYTPVLKILNDREEKLKQGVEDAHKAKEARKNADEEKSVILKEARVEAEGIVLTAKNHAEDKGKDIVTEAETKAARIIEDAKTRARETEEAARKASEADIAKAAILAAEAVLRKH
jgi:F-type H+-transporting ATPase subunit b